MKKQDFSNMRTKSNEKKVIEKRYMDDYREKIRVLRQRLYQLMRVTNGKSV